MQRSTFIIACLSAAASYHVAAQERPPVTLPAAIQADLKSRVGNWTLEDTVITNGAPQQVDTGTMQCKAVAGGMGVLCEEQDNGTSGPNHHRVDLIGYDEERHATRLSVLEDDGAQHSFVGTVHGDTNTIHVKAMQPDGKPVAVTVSAKSVSNDEMRAHTTIEIGGVKVADMTRTYRRAK